MRKRLGALLAAVLAAGTLAALAPQAAQAAPLEGNNVITLDCYKGYVSGTNRSQKLTLDYEIEYTHTTSSVKYYDFQLNLAQMVSDLTPASGSRVNATLTHRNKYSPASPTMISAWGGGNSGSGANLWTSSIPLGTSIRENGVGGVVWNTVEIGQHTNEPNNKMRLAWDSGTSYPCEFYVDLSMPDRPREGNHTVTLECDLGVSSDTLELDFDVTRIGGNLYDVHVNSATYTGAFGYDTPDEIELTLESPSVSPSQNMASNSGNFTSPLASFHDQHGALGVTFPSGTVIYSPGDAPRLGATFIRDSAIDPEDVACGVDYDLGHNWPGELDLSRQYTSGASFRTVEMDDCSSTAAEFSVTPVWYLDGNETHYRLNSLQITQTNTSGSKVVLAAGSSTARGGITIAENRFLAKDITTINGNMSLADRTITSGETLIVPMNNRSKWTRMDGGGDASAPVDIYTHRDRYPTVWVQGKVFDANGNECVPDNAPGTGSIAELDFQPTELVWQ